MSTWHVSIERIGQINVHPNADRLELATLEGKDYEFVVQKGLHQAGDTVIYFPVDSVLPLVIVEKMGLTGKLSGKDKNRVKTVRLRGQISQGLVAPIADLIDNYPIIAKMQDGDIEDILGVTKYEAPTVPVSTGNLVSLPEMVYKYDIESTQNYPHIVQMLMDTPVYITEKIEGSHWAVHLIRNGQMDVCQRNYKIEPVEDKGEHTWHKVAREHHFQDILELILAENPDIQSVTMRGELVGPGIQGNYYQLPHHEVYLFDIEFDGKPIDSIQFLAITSNFIVNGVNIKTAPYLSCFKTLREWLDGHTVKESSNGKSEINSNLLREGIVIKPIYERHHNEIGRLFLKQRSPEYLAENDY